MVSDISHQLKTPVAALDTCFSVLMQNDLSARTGGVSYPLSECSGWTGDIIAIAS